PIHHSLPRHRKASAYRVRGPAARGPGAGRGRTRPFRPASSYRSLGFGRLGSGVFRLYEIGAKDHRILEMIAYGGPHARNVVRGDRLDDLVMFAHGPLPALAHRSAMGVTLEPAENLHHGQRDEEQQRLEEGAPAQIGHLDMEQHVVFDGAVLVKNAMLDLSLPLAQLGDLFLSGRFGQGHGDDLLDMSPKLI